MSTTNPLSLPGPSLDEEGRRVEWQIASAAIQWRFSRALSALPMSEDDRALSDVIDRGLMVLARRIIMGASKRGAGS